MEGYYVLLFSPHGLIRYPHPEIGRDKDTGGQVKYVLELLETLSHHPQVRRVDLFTRKIIDKRVSTTYAQEFDVLNERARIVRIACGGNQYRQKEQLWDYLDEFVDKTIRFIERQDDFPDVVHGHYADGNYLASQLSEVFGIPFLATGHSLGRNKQALLLSQGIPVERIREKFNMTKRIAVEEKVLETADAIVVSTQHEIDSQYAYYDAKDRGKFKVIPPGVNTELFYPFYRQDMPSFKMTLEQEQALYRVNSEIERFLFNPGKPLILSIGRADKRKNFETIIQAFGQDKELQAMANLAIFAGVRKDITQMLPEEQELLTNLLLLLDKYDLYGKMAIPKKNDPNREVPEIYRVAARKKGVFVNATPGENFGLTLVEAAACGLPVVASPTGGPKEILHHCKNGLLVDVEDPVAIADALKKIISDQAVWERYSAQGIQNVNQLYSWDTHATHYLQVIEELVTRQDAEPHGFAPKTAYGKRLVKAELFVISDLDGTLVDGSNTEGLDALKAWVEKNKHQVVFGIASGRNKELTRQALTDYALPMPDIIICSAGSEIYYTDKFIPDNGWESHIDFQWKKDELQEALMKFPGIRLQEPDAQWRFKLSYYVDKSFSKDDLANLHKFLDDNKLRAKILLTENRFLDLLPFRASKGSAVRYLSYKWKMPLERVITAGNSGNDLDMLKGKTRGVVVANYSPELTELKKSKSVYFSGSVLSKGVLEGIIFHTSTGTS
ncbi:MAG: glycosyltransferase [Cyclobacteriaceae bacterium]|nr:glycosyltransferase [Cyclobacteriaceae bacterium]